MEKKNATETNTVDKAEPPAAAAMITVDVDPEALNCPRCLQPLAPPVFQCAAGHVVCSTSYGSLPDKDKCVFCFITTGYTRCFVPTSYSRCLGLERVLGSARVACPNRCSVVKILYHEKAEHQKTCIAHEIGKKRGTGVMKMGPCGGVGGDFRRTALFNANHVIVLVIINHGDAVDSVTVMLGPEGTGAAGSKCGGKGGKRSEFRLEPGEYLTSVEGHYGQFNGIVVVRSLKFVSNIRTYGPYGKEDGAAFALPAGASGKVVGFHFKCGQFIDAIGTYVKMD